MALQLLLAFLALPLALGQLSDVVSARSFDEYVQDVERHTLYMRHGNDQLRAAVAKAEELNKDKVVLYHVMPLYGYLMSWLAHGIMAKEPLRWQRGAQTSGVAAELPQMLRMWEEGMDFPAFALHNASLCAHKEKRKVREADPQQAQVLGDGDWSNYYQTGQGFYDISYVATSKKYKDCNDLVYSQLLEDNKNVGPLMEEARLKAFGVGAGTHFAQYLDEQVGHDWQDAVFPHSYDGMATVGVQDRLLQADINLLGSAVSSAWQSSIPSTWAQSAYFQDVYGDLNADYFSQYSFQPDFGDRSALLDQVLSKLNPGPEALQKVYNLLSLLKCSAQMRFPIYQANFGRRQKIMERCWKGSAEPFPPDAPKMDLDTVASARTKEAATALQSGGLATEDETRGFSRVLLQVVLLANAANELAYVSTDWNKKNGQPPGHEHEDWRGISFVDAYNTLKNTDHGDNFTARVFLRREPFFVENSVKVVAYSQVFTDETFMKFAESVLNDIRLLLPTAPKEVSDYGWMLRVGMVLGLVLLVACLGYRRLCLRPPRAARSTDDVVELPARV